MSLLVDAQWLQAHLADPALVVLDATVLLPSPQFDGDYRVASGYDGWLQAHIPGSRHADLLTALADTQASFSFALPAPDALVQGLAALGAGVDKTLVIYDRADGFWAARLWWMLRGVGIEASVLDGGFNAWRQAGLPEHGGPEASIAAVQPWPINRRPQVWIDRVGVEAIVAGQAPGVLICALGAALFDGSAATRYARRGHIPGSRNLPARNLFDAHGRYLPKDALALAIGPTLLHSEGPLVLYCGGGISAAANALALTLLGRQDITLYDGSLQEWAADARLPMTTGAAPA
ncbi:sulfurtransferase [Pseudomonas sp. VS40]|uniref:sulfurtransferase n=1 Tax=unclassified Pseudomonas TaxID=196821 RepID=UPI001BDDDC86|nr:MULTISPECIES: rhodanese-like domain-containing protein [unclassified Pseudomonas]MBT1263723.1 sulfurtransferase [Pseudomonas sp. VS40]MBT1275545.1 sulfurtransferase [Pseudomonas sp. VS59]